MPAIESTTRIDFRKLQVLVSALSFDAETQRRAVASRKVATVESVGKDRLDMRDLEQIPQEMPQFSNPAGLGNIEKKFPRATLMRCG